MCTHIHNETIKNNNNKSCTKNLREKSQKKIVISDAFSIPLFHILFTSFYRLSSLDEFKTFIFVFISSVFLFYMSFSILFRYKHNELTANSVASTDALLLLLYCWCVYDDDDDDEKKINKKNNNTNKIRLFTFVYILFGQWKSIHIKITDYISLN